MPRTIVLILLALATAAHAQGYPSRPVRIITPFTAGSAIDVLGRVVAQKLAEFWGQQVVIDNRTGASGIIGTDAAAKAAPDGYTLAFGNVSTLTLNPHLFSHIPYDPLKDFVPVSLTAAIPLILIVHPSLPAKSVKELIALAKAHPGELNYASGGAGSAQHMPMEMLRAMAHINIVHVPYKGLTPAFNDVLAGQVPMMWSGVSNVVPLLKSGRLRVLAIGSAQRLATLPDVPTMQEAGVPGFVFDSWTGCIAPAGTPKDIVAKVHADITRALGSPEVSDKLVTLGFVLIGGTPDDLEALVRNDLARFGKLIKAAGIRGE